MADQFIHLTIDEIKAGLAGGSGASEIYYLRDALEVIARGGILSGVSMRWVARAALEWQRDRLEEASKMAKIRVDGR